MQSGPTPVSIQAPRPETRGLDTAGPNYQFDHLLNLEPLELPAEAADPKRAYGGHMHILAP